MPTITVNYLDLCRLSGLESDQALSSLEDKLALVKAELGNRLADGRTLRDVDGSWAAPSADLELRIELKDTNRPDLWSVEGIARQLRDHHNGHGCPYTFSAPTNPHFTIEVDPLLQSIRPFITGFLAQEGHLDETGLLAFIETQEALTRNFGHKRKSLSIGLYRGTGLHFPILYQAKEPDSIRFEPLPSATETPEPWPHGIAMTPAQILAEHPTGREYGSILAGCNLVPFLSDSHGQALSFPPIINSAGLGRIVPGETALFVEVTGIELDQCLLATNILAANLADRGWRILPITTVYPYTTSRGRRVTAPYDLPMRQTVEIGEFERLLGTDVDQADVVAKLSAYGVDAMPVENAVQAAVPPYRQDYLHAVDVVEDYAISRGYTSFSPAMPMEFTVGSLLPLTEFEDWVRDLFIGFGFEEAICNILTGVENLRDKMELNESHRDVVVPFHGGPAVRIENVVNRNYSHVRDWIIPSLLEVEAHSSGALYPHRMFEVGEVAVRDSRQNLGSRTESRAAAIIVDEVATFDAGQSVLYALMANLGIDFAVEPWRHPSFIEGRVALVRSTTSRQSRTGSTQPLGFLGEISPQVLTNWGIHVPMAAFELSVTALEQITHPQPSTAAVRHFDTDFSLPTE